MKVNFNKGKLFNNKSLKLNKTRLFSSIRVRKQLRRMDRLLGFIFSGFIFSVFLYFLNNLLFSLFVQVFLAGFFYLAFFLVYSLPHLFRDLTAEEIAEDFAEPQYRGLEDDWVMARRADQAIINWWEHTVHINFWYEFWRGNYWQEELEEDWDWPMRRGLELERRDDNWNWKTLQQDWYNLYINMARGRNAIHSNNPDIVYEQTDTVWEQLGDDREQMLNYYKQFGKKVNAFGRIYMDEPFSFKSHSIYPWMDRENTFFYGRSRLMDWVMGNVLQRKEDGIGYEGRLMSAKDNRYLQESFYLEVPYLEEGEPIDDVYLFRSTSNTETELAIMKEMDHYFNEDDEWEFGDDS